MPRPAADLSPCPLCHSDARAPSGSAASPDSSLVAPPSPSGRPRRFEWLGGRELLLGAAALGLVAGLGWVSEDSLCEGLERSPAAAAERDAALGAYVEARCEAGRCESVELLSRAGCRAKLRVIEPRFDAYGERIGTFRVDEGLEFSPMLERWRVREVLDDKQLLGLRAR